MFSSVSYTALDKDACAAVRSMLSEVGNLAWFEHTSGSEGICLKALACFKREEDAREAVNMLNNTEAPYSNHVKLVLDLVHSVKFKFFKNVYDVVGPELVGFKAKWKKDTSLNFYDYNPGWFFRVLKIEGRVSEDVAEASAELETILSGVIAMEEKTKLWSPALGFGGSLLQKVKDIERSAGVIIVRDKETSQLRVIGPSARQQIAIQLLAEAIKEDKSASFSSSSRPGSTTGLVTAVSELSPPSWVETSPSSMFWPTPSKLSLSVRSCST